jgi:hypothetical protein
VDAAKRLPWPAAVLTREDVGHPEPRPDVILHDDGEATRHRAGACGMPENHAVLIDDLFAVGCAIARLAALAIQGSRPAEL